MAEVIDREAVVRSIDHSRFESSRVSHGTVPGGRHPKSCELTFRDGRTFRVTADTWRGLFDMLPDWARVGGRELEEEVR